MLQACKGQDALSHQPEEQDYLELMHVEAQEDAKISLLEGVIRQVCWAVPCS